MTAKNKKPKLKPAPKKFKPIFSPKDLGTATHDYEDEGGVEINPSVSSLLAHNSGESERCRRACVYEGVSVKEAAGRFGVTETTVRNWWKKGGWELEIKIVKSGKADAVVKVMEEFARAKELPLVNGYYDLQERALKKLAEILGGADINVHTVGAILEVAERGLNLGERVMSRANPGRARDLRDVLGDGINVGGGGKRGVQVNVLAGALSAQERSINIEEKDNGQGKSKIKRI